MCKYDPYFKIAGNVLRTNHTNSVTVQDRFNSFDGIGLFVIAEGRR